MSGSPKADGAATAIWRRMFEGSTAVQLLIDPEDGAIVEANGAAASFYGCTREELRAMRISDINQMPDELVSRDMGRARSETRNRFEFRHRLASGEVRHVEVFSSPVDMDGRTLLYSIIHDVTERNELEEQLRQVQRMESLGLLAGGVAHDFNNLLTGIVCSAEMALKDVPNEGRAHDFLQEIRRTCQRASEVTHQLLAFSRRQVLRPRLLSLDEVVVEMEQLLAHVLEENVQLAVDARTGARIIADRGRIEQVLMNLAINARDAMPEGGHVHLSVHRTAVDRERAEELEITPGSYVCLRVRDEGSGMDESTRVRVFEPFFTTKPRGRGTGLGLSTVFGIVRQSGGAITVDSVPGEGTTFDVLLPEVEEARERPVQDEPASDSVGGDETVLLVEDDDAIRRIVRNVLERQGYEVLDAADGGTAVDVARSFGGPIHLLLTDLVMPGQSGRELADSLAEDRPGIPVLYMSGYADQPLVEHELLDAGAAFLEKPFTPAALLQKVRAVLDAPATAPSEWA